MSSNHAPEIIKMYVKFAQVVKDLNECLELHGSQKVIVKTVVIDGKKVIFIECGRKFGKTEVVIWLLYFWAMTTPNAACYYIAPFAKQARELIWASNRLQKFLKTKKLRTKYLKGTPNITQMRVNFKNGAFIKLDGADNFEAYRGINPHFMAYEEYKDHRPEFHVIMEPNLASYECPLVIIGTPPESQDNHFCTMADECQREDDSAYFNFPTWANPHISKDWLRKIRNKLMLRGEEHNWLLEYCARRVKGTANLIFPMLDSGKWIKHPDGRKEMTHEGAHFKFHDTIRTEVLRKFRTMSFYCTADPATESVFAVKFTAIDNYTKKKYTLDELYVEDQGEMTVRRMWLKIHKKLLEWPIAIEEWWMTYDEAASWWANEMANEFQVYWMPTRKAKNRKKSDGLSLIKDQMLYGKWVASDRCVNLRYETENYKKDLKTGKIPKKDDHLIDCERYENEAAVIDLIDKEPETIQDNRGVTIEQYMEEELSNDDWTHAIVGDL